MPKHLGASKKVCQSIWQEVGFPALENDNHPIFGDEMQKEIDRKERKMEISGVFFPPPFVSFLQRWYRMLRAGGSL